MIRRLAQDMQAPWKPHVGYDIDLAESPQDVIIFKQIKPNGFFEPKVKAEKDDVQLPIPEWQESLAKARKKVTKAPLKILGTMERTGIDLCTHNRTWASKSIELGAEYALFSRAAEERLAARHEVTDKKQ